jgi:hypothetical protein
MIAGESGEAGYNGVQDYWWTRRNDVVTCYTIEPDDEALAQGERAEQPGDAARD